MKTILISLVGGAVLLIGAGMVAYIVDSIQFSTIVAGVISWLICSLLFYVLWESWKESKQ